MSGFAVPFVGPRFGLAQPTKVTTFDYRVNGVPEPVGRANRPDVNEPRSRPVNVESAGELFLLHFGH